MTSQICIQTYLYRHEADLAWALLDSCGIAATLTADDAGGMQPHLLFGNGGVRLWVSDDRAEEAGQLLAAPFEGEE